MKSNTINYPLMLYSNESSLIDCNINNFNTAGNELRFSSNIAFNKFNTNAIGILANKSNFGVGKIFYNNTLQPLDLVNNSNLLLEAATFYNASTTGYTPLTPQSFVHECANTYNFCDYLYYCRNKADTSYVDKTSAYLKKYHLLYDQSYCNYIYRAAMKKSISVACCRFSGSAIKTYYLPIFLPVFTITALNTSAIGDNQIVKVQVEKNNPIHLITTIQ